MSKSSPAQEFAAHLLAAFAGAAHQDEAAAALEHQQQLAAQEQHGVIELREVLGPVEVRAFAERPHRFVDDRTTAPRGIGVVRIDVLGRFCRKLCQ